MKPLRSVNGLERDATNPCALTLMSKGYRISLIFARRSGGELKAEYSAEKDGVRFSAENEVELLGLVTMWEIRGPDWESKKGEVFVYEVLYSESFIREADGSLVENPMRWI